MQTLAECQRTLGLIAHAEDAACELADDIAVFSSAPPPGSDPGGGVSPSASGGAPGSMPEPGSPEYKRRDHVLRLIAKANEAVGELLLQLPGAKQVADAEAKADLTPKPWTPESDHMDPADAGEATDVDFLAELQRGIEAMRDLSGRMRCLILRSNAMKREAYRMARLCLAMRPDPVAADVINWVEQVGDDPDDLVCAIEHGMSERDYARLHSASEYLAGRGLTK